MDKYLSCPECGTTPDIIVEKCFTIRTVREWNGTEYVESFRSEDTRIIECLHCGTELLSLSKHPSIQFPNVRLAKEEKE